MFAIMVSCKRRCASCALISPCRPARTVAGLRARLAGRTGRPEDDRSGDAARPGRRRPVSRLRFGRQRPNWTATCPPAWPLCPAAPSWRGNPSAPAPGWSGVRIWLSYRAQDLPALLADKTKQGEDPEAQENANPRTPPMRKISAAPALPSLFDDAPPPAPEKAARRVPKTASVKPMPARESRPGEDGPGQDGPVKAAAPGIAKACRRQGRARQGRRRQACAQARCRFSAAPKAVPAAKPTPKIPPKTAKVIPVKGRRPRAAGPRSGHRRDGRGGRAGVAPGRPARRRVSDGCGAGGRTAGDRAEGIWRRRRWPCITTAREKRSPGRCGLMRIGGTRSWAAGSEPPLAFGSPPPERGGGWEGDRRFRGFTVALTEEGAVRRSVP